MKFSRATCANHGGARELVADVLPEAFLGVTFLSCQEVQELWSS
ncbi:hypothetical protein [Rhodococcus marinonascens]|nr:hypothetical protein [Rhodococcus marinonascens]